MRAEPPRPISNSSIDLLIEFICNKKLLHFIKYALLQCNIAVPYTYI